jgi:23S rRNA pseudouridine1911/1915/1917 synthase
VHRLDKGTSGLLVVARTADAYVSLSGQLRAHTAGRHYRALVAGTVEDDAGVVDAPIGRSPRQPTRMAVTRGGRPARTAYTVVARYREPLEATLVEATLDTGRTHQVRVHLAAIGHPVFGDDRYWGTTGRPEAALGLLFPGRLFLHACRLSLDHPGSGERSSWESPLPPDLDDVLRRQGR